MTAGVLALPLALGGDAGDGAVRRPSERVVSRAQAGDADAFRDLYHAHVGRVYALCLRLAGDRREAEELTQDVFVRAWERLGSFRGESAFATWLYRLAVNTVLTARRSRRRREYWTSTVETAAPGSPGREEWLDLEGAIAALPSGCRTVFVLHDVEGWPHQEIAEMEGIAVGTSKAHLFRARRLLRKALDR